MAQSGSRARRVPGQPDQAEELGEAHGGGCCDRREGGIDLCPASAGRARRAAPATGSRRGPVHCEGPGFHGNWRMAGIPWLSSQMKEGLGSWSAAPG